MFSNFEGFLESIGDSQRPFSISSLYALSKATRAEMEAFVNRWPKMEVERRRRIIRSLVEIAEASFEVDFGAIFRFCLADEDEEVRAKAIDGLWEDEDVALIDPLVSMLKGDPSTLVRAQAAIALGQFALLAELEELDERLGGIVRGALLGVIRDSEEAMEVRRRAVEATSFFGDEEVKGIIEAAYCDAEEKMRISAVFAMGRNADPYWNEIVIAELENHNPEMRFEAARGCGELENAEAVPKLIRLISDPDREVQGAAIWALGQIGGEEARRVLQACCCSDDEVLRDVAGDALAELEFFSDPLGLSSYLLDIEEDEDLLDL